MSIPVTWNGDYADHGAWRLAAYHCLGGAKWNVSHGDEDASAQGKVAFSDGYDCLAVARVLAERALAAFTLTERD